MKNQKTLTAILTGAFIAVVAIMMPTSANAQLRYQNQYSKAQVGQIISKLESSSSAFRADFDRAMDNSNLNGTSTEDRYNKDVKNYADSLTKLRREFNRNNSWWNLRNDVQFTIGQAMTVNGWMNNISFRRNLERQWSNMRNDINTLADTFDIAGLEGGGWNGGGGNGGGWNGGGNNGGGWGGGGQMSSPPSWAQGTFYSTSGENIMVTMDGQGRVTVVNGGRTYYGTYYRGNLVLNGDTSAVTKSGNNGFRTLNRNTGQYTTYTRNGNGGWNGGGNNGGGWNGGGNNGGGNTPSWARGTFYNNGSNTQLTISDNGQVTVVAGGQTYYGSYSDGQMTLNGDTSTVQKDGNGIKTYNKNTGQWTSYRRN